MNVAVNSMTDNNCVDKIVGYRLAGLIPCSTIIEERYSPTTGNQCLGKKMNVGEELSVEGSFPLVIHFIIQRYRCHIFALRLDSTSMTHH